MCVNTRLKDTEAKSIEVELYLVERISRKQDLWFYSSSLADIYPECRCLSRFQSYAKVEKRFGYKTSLVFEWPITTSNPRRAMRVQ